MAIRSSRSSMPRWCSTSGAFTSGKPSKDEQEETASEHAYLAKSHLFTASQVEKTAPIKVKTREELMAYNRMLAQQRKARAAS